MAGDFPLLSAAAQLPTAGYYHLVELHQKKKIVNSIIFHKLRILYNCRLTKILHCKRNIFTRNFCQFRHLLSLVNFFCQMKIFGYTSIYIPCISLLSGAVGGASAVVGGGGGGACDEAPPIPGMG